MAYLTTMLVWALGCGGPDREPGPPGGATSDETEVDWRDVIVSLDDTHEVIPGSCDAGTASWVARTLPLVWGRKAHGAQEIAYWAQMADEHGREAAVRAMTEDPQYYVAWLDWYTDALYVARTGDKEQTDCFETPRQTAWDGSIAAHLQAHGPTEAGYGGSFDMADVIVDALVADDVSVIYRAHLFARMDKPVTGANVSSEQLEYNRRVNYGELFYRTYLGRSLTCMACHNSQFSTTDDPDPAEDRTWQIPGHFEEALLGTPTGRNPDEAYSIFRFDAIDPGRGSGDRPWGMDADCGTFLPPSAVPSNDLLGQQVSWFIGDRGPTATMYDVERDLAEGVDALAGVGLTLGDGDEVGGPEAFAYLLAANVASQVWATATGADLVIAHWFPRNEAQMQRLKALADGLVESRFSMRDLLVAVTTDPYFNPGLPETCYADVYGMDPVFDPWTITEDDPLRRPNGASDTVHRLGARALLRSVTHDLGWAPRPFFFRNNIFGQSPNPEEQAFQSAVGVFLRESDPGHRGSDFQGLLSFETEYGTCESSSEDHVDRLLAEAQAEGATVGELAAALKDRLVAEPVAPEEQALVEALLQRSFADPVDDTPLLESRLRLWCGTLLMSPQFQLVTDPPAPGPAPALGSDARADCQRIASLMTAAGTPVDCSGTRLQ
ncbi:MAG: hypothetical protein R3F59_26105 [Myxococcota bacterium]